MSTLSIAAPTETHGFMAKAGALAAGTALAGAALFGGVAAAPTIAAGITGSVQQDYVLTATPAPEVDSFVASLQNVLNTVGVGNMGDVLEQLFGKTTAGLPNVTTGSDLSVLLAALNPTDAAHPNGVTLDAVTGGLLSTDITALLSDVKMAGGVTLGDVPIDTLLGGFIGGSAGIDTTVGALLTQLGFGPYVGLLNLPMLGLAPGDTIGSLLNSFLGIGATTSLNGLLEANGMTNATIGGLLGITPTQLGEGWDQFVDGIKLGGSIMDPTGTGTLGGETLGALLTSLLGPDATTTIGDSTTVTDFLSDLGIFHMLGLS